jgi:curved DNA-binding protein CbpA
MHRLGQHPDAGGDTGNAALINEAYTVLSDPKQRAAYDLNLLANIRERRPRNEETPANSRDDFTDTSCPFCEQACLGSVSPDSVAYCKRCGSPLNPVSKLQLDKDLRRTVTRVRRGGDLRYFTHWPSKGYLALIYDLSPNGVGMTGPEAVTAEQRIKLTSDLMIAVARVRHCQSRKGGNTSYSIGAEFITLQFTQNSGTFMSESV